MGRRPPAGLPRPAGGPLAPLLRAWLLPSLLLDGAVLLTPAAQGPPDFGASPPLNLRFDPWRMNLTWDRQDNATGVQCDMVHPERELIRKKLPGTACHCAFRDVSLHRGVALAVNVTTRRGHVAQKLVFENRGGAGTAARNFSCSVYEVDFMNCTWAKGPAAPGDVQYFLSMRDGRHSWEAHCPHYLDDGHAHVGCHLRNLSGLGFHSYFLVTGSSREADVQFLDAVLSLKDIETYGPPRNLSVSCNGSHCLLRWAAPRTRRSLSPRDLQYQLDVRAQDGAPLAGDGPIVVFGSATPHYVLPSPEPRRRHTVRMRSANLRAPRWGAWGAPVHFGCEDRPFGAASLYATVVLGTAVFALGLGLLFRRLLAGGRLCPPVPRIKDKWNEPPVAERQVSWDQLTGSVDKLDDEEGGVLTIQEVTPAPTGL